MSSMIGQRRLKQLLTPWLPEAWKAPFRARLHGYRDAQLSLESSFETGDDGLSVTIDRRLRLKLREEDRSDLQYHLVGNGASIDELASFLSLARNATTFFDIGAAKGIFSLLFCLSGPDKRAVAFEPAPDMVASARALAALNGVESRLHVRHCAVGRQAGHGSGRVLGGLVYVDSTDASGAAVDFEMTSVDAEVDRLGVRPGILKIDVEGYEYKVLLGASRLLRERRPTLAVELHLDLLELRGVSPRQVVAELRRHGYAFRTCAGRPLSASDIHRSLNALLRFVAV